MKERLKTLVLAILVTASLVQSYVLAYGRPKLDLLAPTNYVPSELGGTQAELKDLLYPYQIVLHLGERKHTLLTPFSPQQQFYKMVYRDFLQKRRFESLRKLTPENLSDLNWNTIKNENEGIEIRFREAVPMKALQRILDIKTDGDSLDEARIDRILIYANTGSGEPEAYFFTDQATTVYAARTDMDISEVRKNVAFGQYLTPYEPHYSDYYLPEKSVPVVRYTVGYEQFTADELKRSLFVDPNIVKNLQEKDGSQIYTDAKRGLQLQNERHWLIFTDPVTGPSTGRTGSAADLDTAIQFINQHGGWNSTFLMERLFRSSEEEPNQLVFRQYRDFLPILGGAEEDLGAIKLQLVQGAVTSFERSLIKLNGEATARHEMELPGGEALWKLVQSSKHAGDIVDVFPAYSAKISDKSVELIPRWAVELRDGTYDFL
ncbi:YycH family regulatory protein [Gorillibacterium timonense]|uniref:YycH family regulatory protein n=1 Tax=Gorillibacterium timonense TaxID=1689269 RepID=UPI00071E564D|nr:two-component system activity regulator YycH [Gorillibacterium timonense]